MPEKTMTDMDPAPEGKGETKMGNDADSTFEVLARIPMFRKTISQVVLTGFVCFLCPGMFNALNGGGGLLDSSVNSRANTALYTTFAVVGFAAGSFLNYFGARLTLAVGGLGYAVYSSAYLCYKYTQNDGYVIFSGALLGCCAGLLWCAQGTVMMSYPTESQKGRYIGIFWAIFNLGAVIGSLIPLGTNWNTNQEGDVVTGTYVGFLVLMLAGAVLAFFLIPPEKIVRSDGTRVQRLRHPSALMEVKGLWTTMQTDPYILLLFPLFWASNWFYTYQFNCYNVFMFNTRTKAFTGLFYWVSQIIGSLLYGFFLDNQRLGRRSRAIWGGVVLFVIVNVVWGGGLKAELQMARPKDPANPVEFRRMDVFDDGFFGYLFLYMCYGFLDSTWQTYAYWLMGALSNETRKLAYFSGYYKGIQSAGAAVGWGLDSGRASYESLFISSWVLNVAGLIIAVPVIWNRVHDTEITEVDYATKKDVEEIQGAVEMEHVTDGGKKVGSKEEGTN
ncbi:MFS general substrate transporter [Ascodesmis nigricans]|uniref:MFS general substrate transporter n=1 Tax=Ascodesmis nigricans TaxID=341454 RepID=A0A4S2MHM4_9PEZI|nr:MFS general substrate transporter [Ascodesmis nigricans]